MNLTKTNDAYQIEYARGMTVQQLHEFLGGLIATGKKDAEVFLNDGAYCCTSLALKEASFAEGRIFTDAPVTPANGYEAVVADYLQAVRPGYVDLMAFNAALSVEQMNDDYSKMLDRGDKAEQPTLVSASNQLVGASSEMHSANDPYVDEYTVGEMQELIGELLEDGRVTKDSPFRIHTDKGVFFPRTISAFQRYDQATAEPLDAKEREALEVYERINVNHLRIRAESSRFNSASVYQTTGNMHGRAETIPALALRLAA